MISVSYWQPITIGNRVQRPIKASRFVVRFNDVVSSANFLVLSQIRQFLEAIVAAKLQSIRHKFQPVRQESLADVQKSLANLLRSISRPL
jgi:hypothetical protein